MNKLVSILIAGFAIFLSANAVAAQEPAQRSGLYLEVVDHWNATPDLRPVPAADDKFGGGWGPFTLLPSWSPPADFLPVRAVNVLQRMEGEAVRVKVSVFLGKKSHEKEEQVATFLARENVKVIVTELKHWGSFPMRSLRSKLPYPLLAQTRRWRIQAEIGNLGIKNPLRENNG
jgi:hypothetical protein